MSDRNFRQMLEAQWSRSNFVCVGLDSEFSKIPESARRSGNECEVSVANTIVGFNRAIVEATRDIVCAYKPNAAFYEEHGAEGIAALHRTIADIHTIAPNVPVILDAKRADIGSTNAAYVRMAFGFLQADAITVHPYLGAEAMQPFLDCGEKGIFVLCRTSNPGAGELQDIPIRFSQQEHVHVRMNTGTWLPSEEVPLYQYVAHSVATKWNTNGNCAVVVGATYPDELQEVRQLVGDMPILIPGVGFQQKDVPLETQVEQIVSAGKDSRGQGMIINSSRGIIFASKGADFAEATRRETERLRGIINQYR